VADVIDVANEQAQMILEKQINLVRVEKLNAFPNVSGQCWECDTPVPDGRRWCSTECRDRSEL
jgi:hypothetical protein